MTSCGLLAVDVGRLRWLEHSRKDPERSPKPPVAPNVGSLLSGSLLRDVFHVDVKQVLLVGPDVALPLRDGLVIAHPDLLSDLVDQAEVVADEHEAAVELLDCLREGVDGLDVEMVGRLVEEEHVGGRHAEHGQDNAALLPLAQVPDLHRLHLSSDAVAADEAAPALNVAGEVNGVGVHVLEELQRLQAQAREGRRPQRKNSRDRKSDEGGKAKLKFRVRRESESRKGRGEGRKGGPRHDSNGNENARGDQGELG